MRSDPSHDFRSELDTVLPAILPEGHQSPIHDEILPGDERRRVAGEKHRGTGYVVGDAGAWNGLHGGEQILYGAEYAIRLGALQTGALGKDTGDDSAGRNRIDASAFAADFGGRGAR